MHAPKSHKHIKTIAVRFSLSRAGPTTAFARVNAVVGPARLILAGNTSAFLTTYSSRFATVFERQYPPIAMGA